MKNTAIGCLVLTVGCVGLLWILGWVVGVRTEHEGSVSGAYSVCKQFVTKRLRSPGSATFPPLADISVATLSTNGFRVSAYVDSQNGFGALLRTNFVCEVDWIDGASYRLVSLDMQ